MRFPRTRILMLAKAPVPGRVKTRLVPVLGPEGAANLAGELLSDAIDRVLAAALAPLELWCRPDTAHPAFQDLARAGVTLHYQRGRDLGARMRLAVADALTRAGNVLLIGSDLPGLDGPYLELAIQALEGADAVIGPTEDGGYGLLGLRRAEPALFEGVPWGSASVADITRARMRGLGWRWAELPLLWDLDRPEDLARYRALRHPGGA